MTPAVAAPLAIPQELSGSRVGRRVAFVVVAMAAVAVGVALLPGLDSLRTRLAGAQPAWLAAAVALKLASAGSYVLVFRAVFCPRMRRRLSFEIGMSELGANAVLPTGGAGGLALGAWALGRSGMAAADIARRTVAFFLLTSVANIAGVVILGLGLAVGLFGSHVSLALSLGPAGAAVGAIAATLGAGALARRLQTGVARRHGAGARRVQLLAALAGGVDEALSLLRHHDRRLLAGAAGYLAFDVMMLWATFHAFGSSPDLAIIWIGYLIGELGGLVPLPGGLGGVDAGLLGTLTLYGVDAAAAGAAVLAYRVIAIVVPAAVGALAFVGLRRTLRDEQRLLLDCRPGTSVDAVGLGAVNVEQPAD